MDKLIAIILIALFGLYIVGSLILGDSETSIKGGSTKVMQQMVEEQKSMP